MLKPRELGKFKNVTLITKFDGDVMGDTRPDKGAVNKIFGSELPQEASSRTTRARFGRLRT